MSGDGHSHEHAAPAIPADEKLQFRAPAPLMGVCAVATLLGAICFAVGLLGDDPGRAWINWIIGSFFIAGLGLFGIFFLAFNSLTTAGWHILVKRVAESMTAILPIAGILTVGFLLLVHFHALGHDDSIAKVYEWAHHHDDHGDAHGHADDHMDTSPAVVHTDPDTGAPVMLGALAARQPTEHAFEAEVEHREHTLHAYLLHHKAAWLSTGFFTLRVVIYFLIWIVVAFLLVKHSRAQDRNGSLRHTHAQKRISAVGMILLALSVTMASFDLLMSLDPTWFSTMYGAYRWIGLYMAGYAVMIIFIFLLRRFGYLKSVNENHFHNLGLWLKACCAFWAYIWFCQFLLIWYSNIPEETAWFMKRWDNGWYAFTMVLTPLLCWAIPFLMLLQRPRKRDEKFLAMVAVIVLIGCWVDLYVNAMNPVSLDTPNPSMVDGTFLFFVGLFGLVFLKSLERAPLIPTRDPYLVESLTHEI